MNEARNHWKMNEAIMIQPMRTLENFNLPMQDEEGQSHGSLPFARRKTLTGQTSYATHRRLHRSCNSSKVVSLGFACIEAVTLTANETGRGDKASMDDDYLGKQLPSGKLTGINFGILTEREVEKKSSITIEAPSEVTDPKLGLPNPSYECSTCGVKDSKCCEGHFGIVKFHVTTLHPYFVSEVVHILNKICPGCRTVQLDQQVKGVDSKSKRNQTEGCKYCDRSLKEWYPRMKFRASSKELFRKTAVIVEIREKMPKKFRNKTLEDALPADYWDFIPRDDQQPECYSTSNRRVLTHAQVHYLLRDIPPVFVEQFVSRRESLFLNCFPVTPNSHRVFEVFYGFTNEPKLMFDEHTKAYKKLVDFKGTANELGSRVQDCLKVSKASSASFLFIYSLLLCAENLPSTDPAYSTKGSKWFKELVMAKRSNHVFRMVVVGDPNIKLTEIGIPCHVAERLQVSEQLNSWNWDKLSACCDLRLFEKGEIFVRRKGNLVRVRHVNKLQMGDTIFRSLVDGDIALINRPPSIHQHSLIGLSVKILPINSALSINPLCCSPFRGDFDGDCLHGYIPQSLDSRIELRELVALDKQLINGQNGRNLLSLCQDSLTAAYLVTEEDILLNKYQMQQLEMFCSHRSQLPAMVRGPSLNSCAWTGKQLFSLLLPPGLNYDVPVHNIHISQGEILTLSGITSCLKDADENLFSCIVKHCQSGSLDFLYTAQEILCEWLSLRGLTVSLADIYLASERNCWENMMREVSCGLDEAEKTCNLIQMMVDSGSKGNPHKLAQQSMCLGLQHSLVPLSFAIPRDLSCAAWNQQKALGLRDFECAKSYIPCAVIKSSFLAGLTPFECFVHSVTNRDSSFSDHAEVPGTLTRRLMYFMRDLYLSYDGTVRNAYGNQIVEFSYDTVKETSVVDKSVEACIGETTLDYDSMGGKPVGSLSACALSEAAYSALDQPVSSIEASPLINLKKLLECGMRKAPAEQSASLYLSKNLGRKLHGFEYGALEVKGHLERLRFSDIVSAVTTYFSPKTSGKKRISTWVCHFHVDKESAMRKQVNLLSVVKNLTKRCKSARVQGKIDLPNLEITTKDCSLGDIKKGDNKKVCIMVTVLQNSKTSPKELDRDLVTVRDLVIPFILGTVVKGFVEFKKVDIFWNDQPNPSISCRGSHGELCVRVWMSENCVKTKFWDILKNHCIQIMDTIDWERSHPDEVYGVFQAYGIASAYQYFLGSLNCAISDTGKSILPQHLLLAADCLSATGEFVALSARGLARQREQTSVSSPFIQACLYNPGASFIKAAKVGADDNLQGIVDALAWGRVPSIGTGGKFELLYTGKGLELTKSQDIYKLLGSPMVPQQNVKIKVSDTLNYTSDKYDSQLWRINGESPFKFESLGRISKSFL
ncbi:RNA polymerase Rpb1, domain 1, partial [Dillenia turbinata]